MQGSGRSWAGLALQVGGALLALGLSHLPVEAQQKWAIVVGIDRYSRINQPLSAAVADAKAMARLLEEVLGFPREKIVLLTSEKNNGPLHTDITYEISLMSRSVKPEDTFVFFFAGHGMERADVGYLLAWNSDPRAPETLEDSAVSVARMVERLKAMPARTKLLIFDACRTPPVGLGRSGPGSKELPAGLARGLRTVVEQAPSAATTALLFSCSVNQEAFEWPQIERGFFSYHLEKGLRGAAAGPDGQITLGSLIQYVQKAVPTHVKSALGREQSPYVEPQTVARSSLVLVPGGSARPGPPASPPTMGTDPVNAAPPVVEAPPPPPPATGGLPPTPGLPERIGPVRPAASWVLDQRHRPRSGVGFRYPRAWTLEKKRDGKLVLLPPATDREEGESYVVYTRRARPDPLLSEPLFPPGRLGRRGGGAHGGIIFRRDPPPVDEREQFSELEKKAVRDHPVLRSLQRVEEAERPRGRSSRSLRFQDRSTGETRGRLLLVIDGSHAAGVFAMSSAGRLAGREAMLRELCSSLESRD